MEGIGKKPITILMGNWSVNTGKKVTKNKLLSQRFDDV